MVATKIKMGLIYGLFWFLWTILLTGMGLQWI